LLWNFSVGAGTLVDSWYTLACASFSVPEESQTFWKLENGVWRVVIAVSALVTHAAAFVEVPSLVLIALLSKALARTGGVVPHEVFW